MENISHRKEFENIQMHKKTLVAPWIVWETILFRDNNKKERKPKKIIWIEWNTKWYWWGCLGVMKWKTYCMYSSSFQNQYFKWNTPQEIDVMEWIYETWKQDERWNEIYNRWFLIDWKIYCGNKFILVPLTDRPWLHEWVVR